MFVFIQVCQCLLFPLSLSDCNYMADYSVTSARKKEEKKKKKGKKRGGGGGEGMKEHVSQHSINKTITCNFVS